MAEAALYMGFGSPAHGRERASLETWNDSLQYFGRLQQDGKIERFDLAVLSPTGGNTGGFIMLRGTAAQIDALRRDDEFLDLLNRVQMIVDGLCVADAWVDEGLAQQITRFEKVIAQVG